MRMTTPETAHSELGDKIFEVLAFCYSDEHKEYLNEEAARMGATFEQLVAAALTGMIAERFDFQLKTDPMRN